MGAGVGGSEVGGSEVVFHLFVVFDRGEWQLPGTFFGIKKIVPANVFAFFKSRKYIQLHFAKELSSRFLL